MTTAAPLQAVFLGTVPYRDGWRLQRRLAQARRAGEVPDTLLMLEHPPVYTVGRNGEAEHLGDGPDALRGRGAEVIDVDRGGSVTFHGPGQLVAYPIVSLAEVFPLASRPGHGDVDVYLRALEEALIATVAERGIVAERRPPYTGIWLPERSGQQRQKLAAIGVKLAGGVTTHGVALNVTTDLGWFSHVTPCGILDAGVASIRSASGATPSVASVAQVFARCVATAFSRRLDAAGEGLTVIVDESLGVPANSD